jgi:RNA polymerase sigma-B factor
MIASHMPLARQLARRYHATWESQEDVEQVAYLALVQAVDAFDLDRGTAFPSYAVPCIVGAIKRYFRDHSWAVRVPRHLQELALRIQRLDDQLFAGQGRRPTAAELAAASGVDVEQVLEAREAQRALYSESLDQPLRSVDDQDASLIETLGEADVELDRVVDRAALDAALAQLDERERLIVQLYYREEITQAEIGERLGCSQMQISRLIRAAMARMRTIIPHDERASLKPAA